MTTINTHVHTLPLHIDTMSEELNIHDLVRESMLVQIIQCDTFAIWYGRLTEQDKVTLERYGYSKRHLQRIWDSGYDGRGDQAGVDAALVTARARAHRSTPWRNSGNDIHNTTILALQEHWSQYIDIIFTIQDVSWTSWQILAFR